LLPELKADIASSSQSVIAAFRQVVSMTVNMSWYNPINLRVCRTLVVQANVRSRSRRLL